MAIRRIDTPSESSAAKLLQQSDGTYQPTLEIDTSTGVIYEGGAAIPSGGGGSSVVQLLRHVLTPEELKSANATPVILIPAPGAGMAIVPMAAHWAPDISSASAAYANIGDLQTFIGNPALDVWFGLVHDFADGNLGNINNWQQRWQSAINTDPSAGLMFALGAAPLIQITNKPFVFATNLNASGELTDGDFPVTLNVLYAIVTL